MFLLEICSFFILKALHKIGRMKKKRIKGKGMEKTNNKKHIKIIGMIVLIMVLLLLLFQCGGETEKEAIQQDKDPLSALLEEMKEDEAILLALYDRSDICSEAWTEEFLLIAKKFQSYQYEGSEEGILHGLILFVVIIKYLRNTKIVRCEAMDIDFFVCPRQTLFFKESIFK